MNIINYFNIEAKDFRDSAIDYEKMSRDEINRGMGLPVEMVDMREKILSSISLQDRINVIYGSNLAGTLFGQPINLHNYPNIGLHKEQTLRERLQKEVSEWLSI